MDYGREDLVSFVDSANKSVFVSVQIETAAALDAIDDIVSIEGLDSVVLGPMDLSGSLGLLGQLAHPKVEDAMTRVIEAALREGVYVGIGMAADRNLAQRWLDRGVHWVQLGCDFEYLLSGARSAFAVR